MSDWSPNFEEEKSRTKVLLLAVFIKSIFYFSSNQNPNSEAAKHFPTITLPLPCLTIKESVWVQKVPGLSHQNIHPEEFGDDPGVSLAFWCSGPGLLSPPWDVGLLCLAPLKVLLCFLHVCLMNHWGFLEHPWDSLRPKHHEKILLNISERLLLVSKVPLSYHLKPLRSFLFHIDPSF